MTQYESIPDNPYILLTPGPLTTSKRVRAALVQDWCTWDDAYNQGVVQVIRKNLLALATAAQGYTSVLMQGSGSASVESAMGTFVPKTDAKVLILANGAYGKRIGTIAEYLHIPHTVLWFDERSPVDIQQVAATLDTDTAITHVAMVHCETTTGILNDVPAVAQLAKSCDKIVMVDAMSSFGGVPMDMDTWGIDVLISSANKCIQGVPGFGFVIAKHSLLETCKGNARSLVLDLYDQWRCMENNTGKWRFTSPTHTVHAFYHALQELAEEGGVHTRYQRYRKNHQVLVDGMTALGFKTLLKPVYQSPIITSFLNPDHPEYVFKRFYDSLKQKGFVIYPGKVSDADCFRVGNIGDIDSTDMQRFIDAVASSLYWQ